MPTDVITSAAEDTLRQGIHQTVRELVDALGATSVAILAATKDLKAPYKWSKEDGPAPRLESAKRIKFAHGLWLALSTSTNTHIARSWFLGVNPRLGDIEPLLAIREGRLHDVGAAARAFLEEGQGRSPVLDRTPTKGKKRVSDAITQR